MVKSAEITPASLIELRQKRGWNQSELAQKLHLTQGTVSKLERGLLPIEGPIVPLLQCMIDERAPV